MTIPPSPWTLEGRLAKLATGEFSAVVNVDRPSLGIHNLAWDGTRIEALRRVLGLVESGPLPSEQIRPIEDAYVRGRDLVAIYAETKDHPLRYVVYWRSLGEEQLCGAAAGLDVVVSVQTSVLGITPAVFLNSEICADRAWRVAPPTRTWTEIAPRTLDSAFDTPSATAGTVHIAGRAASDDALLFDLAGSSWGYAEMIHPLDRMLSDEKRFDSGADARRDEADARDGAHFVHTRHRILGLRLEKGVLLRARLRAVLTPRSRAREIVAACGEQFEHAELPLTT